MKKLLFILFAVICLSATAQEDAVAPVWDVTRPNPKTTAQMNSMTRMVEGSEVYNTDTQTDWKYISGVWVNQAGGGSADGNDFVTSLGLAGNILTATVPNQTNPTVDLSSLQSTTEVSEDLSPVLGGNLDANGFSLLNVAEISAETAFLNNIGSFGVPFASFYGRTIDLQPTTADPAVKFQHDGTDWGFLFNTGGATAYTKYYTLNPLGTPTLATDLVDKSYIDTNSVLFTELTANTKSISIPATIDTNIGIGGGLGNGIAFDADGSLLVYKDNAVGGVSNMNMRFLSNNTANREYTFPNKSGTVAFLDDIAGGSGTIGGTIADNQIAVGGATANSIEGSGNLTYDGTTLKTGHTFSSPYPFSVQSNTANTYLEILNNAGAGKGVFFGIENNVTPNDFALYNEQQGPITLNTNPIAGQYAVRLIVEAGGDVGIGNTNPTEKLDVTGNIKASGNFIGDGSQLTGLPTLANAGQSIPNATIRQITLGTNSWLETQDSSGRTWFSVESNAIGQSEGNGYIGENITFREHSGTDDDSISINFDFATGADKTMVLTPTTATYGGIDMLGTGGGSQNLSQVLTVGADGAGLNMTNLGDVTLTTTGSTSGSPSLLGFDGFSAAEFARFQFGDRHNSIQNGFGQWMDISAYHTLRITGGQQGTPTNINYQVGDAGGADNIGVLISTLDEDRSSLVVKGIAAQTVDLFQVRDELDAVIVGVTNADELDLNNNQLINLGDPTLPQHGATKAYVDANAGNPLAIESDVTGLTGAAAIDNIVSGTEAEIAGWAVDSTRLDLCEDCGPAGEDTGSVLNMSDYFQYNMSSANSSSTYTLTDIRAGGYSEVLINKSGAEPTITGASKLPNTADFIASTNMIMSVKTFGSTVKYWFTEY